MSGYQIFVVLFSQKLKCPAKGQSPGRTTLRTLDERCRTGYRCRAFRTHPVRG